MENVRSCSATRSGAATARIDCFDAGRDYHKNKKKLEMKFEN
jgi:hypothetical protein